MGTGRLEAFSDGVIAIIITIMVLEMKVPHGHELEDLKPLLPVFLSYVLSFIYVGIYWNNHHHMMHTVKRVTGSILWANLQLLFWLSLIPFVTAWAGESHFAALPSLFYGVGLIMSAFSFILLQTAIIKSEGQSSLLKTAVGSEIKGKISLVMYAVAILVAMWQPRISLAIYAAVALMWLIPDKRIEKVL